MATLKDLRLALRSHFDDWPLEDKITQECLIDDKWITVSDPSLYTPGKLLSIDQEIMRITDVGTTSGIVNVQRGYEGTAKASHAINSIVYIFDKFSDKKLNAHINDAILALWPMVYQRLEDESITTNGSDKYTLPTGLEFVQEVYLIRLDDSSIQLVRSWNVAFGKIEFPVPVATGYKLRLIGGARYKTLDSDTGSLPSDFPSALEQALIDYATSKLLAERESKRTEFTEYAALLNERASRPAELGASSRTFLQKFMIARSENAVLRRGYRRRAF